MRTMRSWLFAIVAIMCIVNNSSWGIGGSVGCYCYSVVNRTDGINEKCEMKRLLCELIDCKRMQFRNNLLQNCKFVGCLA